MLFSYFSTDLQIYEVEKILWYTPQPAFAVAAFSNCNRNAVFPHSLSPDFFGYNYLNLKNLKIYIFSLKKSLPAAAILRSVVLVDSNHSRLLRRELHSRTNSSLFVYKTQSFNIHGMIQSLKTSVNNNTQYVGLAG